MRATVKPPRALESPPTTQARVICRPHVRVCGSPAWRDFWQAVLSLVFAGVLPAVRSAAPGWEGSRLALRPALGVEEEAGGCVRDGLGVQAVAGRAVSGSAPCARDQAVPRPRPRHRCAFWAERWGAALAHPRTSAMDACSERE